MKIRDNHILRIALLVLFVSYYSGSTLFFHTHHTSHGEVTHSHPYLPSASHSHSAASFHLVDQLSSLQFYASDCVALFYSFAHGDIYYCIEGLGLGGHTQAHWALRGPPVG